MKNVKVEAWEKFGICYLRIGPVLLDKDSNPIMKGEIPQRDMEKTGVICALPKMRKSRSTGVFSMTWAKIRSTFNPRLEEVTDSTLRSKSILRGLTHVAKRIVPRVSRSRTDGRNNLSKFTTTLQIEDYAHGPDEVIGSLGVTEDDKTPVFTALHARHLIETLDACTKLGTFRGQTGQMDFSEGRSMLKDMIGKIVVWDLCDDDGETIEANIGDPVAAS